MTPYRQTREMRAYASSTTILAVIISLLLALLASVQFASRPLFGRTAMIGLIALEAALFLIMLYARIRARKTEQERHQVAAVLSAIRSGVLY